MLGMKKKNIVILFALVSLCSSCNVEMKNVDRGDNSELFELVKEECRGFIEVGSNWFDWFSPNVGIYVCFGVIVLFCFVSLFVTSMLSILFSPLTRDTTLFKTSSIFSLSLTCFDKYSSPRNSSLL